MLSTRVHVAPSSDRHQYRIAFHTDADTILVSYACVLFTADIKKLLFRRK